MLQTSNDLIRAVFLGNHDEFSRLLDEDSVKYQDPQKRSVLHAAAHCGELGMVEALLFEGARVNLKDTRWYTALHRACASNSFDVVRILLAHEADRSARDKSWQTPLHVAAANASLACVQLLFEPPESITHVNASDRMGHSPLHHAVSIGRTETAQFLLEKGASVNAFDNRDRRAMHWAAACGNIALIELLTHFGAEVNCRDKDQFTPLHTAASLGFAQSVNSLIAFGAELDATTAHGNTALHIACLNGHDTVVEVLLAAIADSIECFDSPASSPSNVDSVLLGSTSPMNEASLNVADSSSELELERRRRRLEAVGAAVNMLSKEDRLNAIHLSVCSTDGARCLRLLLQATCPRLSLASTPLSEEMRSQCLTALTTPGGQDGSLPIHMAALHGRFDRAEVLIRYGADIDAVDGLGNTALHIAADRGHEPFISGILQAGCRWDARGQAGSTALHRAALSGFPSCLIRLISAALYAPIDAKSSIPTNLESGNHDETTDHQCLQLWESLCSPDRDPISLGASSLERLQQLMNLRDDHGRSLLHAAALGADLDCLKLVLMCGADPLDLDADGRSALHYTVASSAFGARSPVVPRRSNSSSIVDRDDDSVMGGVNTLQTVDRGTVVRENAVRQAVTASLVFLKLACPAGVADRFGCTPLHLACAYDQTGALVRQLLFHDAVNVLFSITTWPPCRREVSDARSLGPFEQDMPLSTESQSRYTPLHVAVNCRNAGAVQALLDYCPIDRLAAYTLGTMTSSVGSRESEQQSLGDGDIATTPLSTRVPSPFLFAALRGDRIIMQLLLEAWSRTTTHKPQPNTAILPVHEHDPASTLLPGQLVDSSGHTALHLAAHAGHVEICRLLLLSTSYGARIGDKDAVYRWHALHHSADQGHADTVSLLLSSDTPQSNTTAPGAAHSVDFRCEVDEHGRTALMLAAQNNHTAVLRLILSDPVLSPFGSNTAKRDALVNRTDVYGRTALHRAAANGHVECVKLLLQYGADATIRDFRQRQALHMVATVGQLSTMQLLLEHINNMVQTQELFGSTMDNNLLHPLDQAGFSPLHYAVFRGHRACIEALLFLPSYSRMRGNTFTPLHCAVLHGYDHSVLQLLLNQYGRTNLSTQDVEGRTVLHMAALCKQANCIEQLLTQAQLLLVDDAAPQHSVSMALARFLSRTDNRGRTALMLAASSGATDCAERLLLVHAKLVGELQETNVLPKASSLADTVDDELLHQIYFNYTDAQGRTVLHHACMAPSDTVGLVILSHIEDIGLLNTPDQLHRTPLHLAIAAGLSTLAEALINRGADLYALDSDGCFPILSAAASIQTATCLSLGLTAMLPQVTTNDATPNDRLFMASKTFLALRPPITPCSTGRLTEEAAESVDEPVVTHSSPSSKPHLMSNSIIESCALEVAVIDPVPSCQELTDPVVSSENNNSPFSFPGSDPDFF